MLYIPYRNIMRSIFVNFTYSWENMLRDFKKLAFNFTAAAKSYPTLCNLIDGSPPGSSIPGILQARTLEWVAISFPNEWKWRVKVKSLSHVWLLAHPWTAAYEAPLSRGFSRQEYWSGLPLPSPIISLVVLNQVELRSVRVNLYPLITKI